MSDPNKQPVKILSALVIALGVLLGSASVSYGQYTDIINSNRPGNTIGAYTVGLGVYQIESGFTYDRQVHHLLDTSYHFLSNETSLRMGLLLDNLEISYDFGYQIQFNNLYSVHGINKNSIGIKLLVWDPYKDRKTDVYSWRANNSFQLKNLLPAIAMTLKYTKFGENNPFNTHYTQDYGGYFLSAQQHLTPYWVILTNFSLDKSDLHREKAITTSVTHAFAHHPNWSAFIEGQSIINDFYSDEILRAGAAYLVHKNLQLDACMGVNFKNTPTRFIASFGLSYRVDRSEKVNLNAN